MHKNRLNIFLHLPKTAGSSVWKILDMNFEPSEIISIGANFENVKKHLDKLVFLEKPIKDNIKLVKGHVAFGCHNVFPDKQPNYFTIFRNPKERTLSHYNFILEQSSHYLNKDVVNRKYTFIDYIESGITEEMNNGMTRLISGYEELLQKPFPKSKFIYGSNDSEMLKTAIDNLDNYFEFVGVQEDFKSSMFFMKKAFNISRISFFETNITKKIKTSISYEEKKVINKYNQLDIELYEYAKVKMEKQKKKNKVKLFFFKI